MPGLLVSSIAFSVAALLAPAALAAELSSDDPKDLYFGEALYYAQQEEYFEALERLDAEITQHYAVDEPQLDSLHPQIGYAEFSVGDFELSYRMHTRAGRAIKRVLEGNVPEPVRNEGAFRLARIHFQKGHPEEALQALDAIHGEIPVAIQDDIEFLRANVYLALGRPSDAVPVLEKIQGSQGLKGFAAYNLGIALLQEGQQREALEQLDRAGRVDSDDASTLAIRDKSNLVLGSLLFEASEFGPAQDAALLRAYFGGAPPAAAAGRLVLYQGLCDLVWTLWGLIQVMNDNPADDFWAYALNRFERCRRLMASPKFARAIAAVRAG